MSSHKCLPSIYLTLFISLELNIHQRILSDIASNVGNTKDDFLDSRDLIAANVRTRAEETDTIDGSEEDKTVQRVFMVRGELIHQ